MTFCSEKQNDSLIIKKVEYNNIDYKLFYLDGTESSFINADKDYLEKLEEILIEQAKERQNLDYISININKWGSFITGIASISMTNNSIQKNLLNVACFGLVLSLYLIKNYRKNSKRLKELKKYKILLENYNEFKKNPNISKLVEFDDLYKEPVNIFTIDEFSLNDIKVMKKGLKK